MGAVIDRLKQLICDWTHGGGRVKRDPSGRINWQCDTCGRWGDPVGHETEQRVIEGDIRRDLAKRVAQ